MAHTSSTTQGIKENSTFNPMQMFVAKNYDGGALAWHIDTAIYNEELKIEKTGDGLFEFLLSEAGGAADVGEYQRMLQTAIDQLRSLQGALAVQDFDSILSATAGPVESAVGEGRSSLDEKPWVVVRNPGLEDEAIVKGFDLQDKAYRYMQYLPERSVDLMKRVDGCLTTEF